MPRTLARIAFLALTAQIAFSACTPRLPALPPQDTLVRDVPILCPGGKLYYLHVYDTNPDGEGFVSVVGPATQDHQHSPPFLVIVGDEHRILTYYVSSDGGDVQRLTQAEYEARYGDGRLTASVCRLAAERRAASNPTGKDFGSSVALLGCGMTSGGTFMRGMRTRFKPLPK